MTPGDIFSISCNGIECYDGFDVIDGTDRRLLRHGDVVMYITTKKVNNNNWAIFVNSRNFAFHNAECSTNMYMTILKR